MVQVQVNAHYTNDCLLTKVWGLILFSWNIAYFLLVRSDVFIDFNRFISKLNSSEFNILFRNKKTLNAHCSSTPNWYTVWHYSVYFTFSGIFISTHSCKQSSFKRHFPWLFFSVGIIAAFEQKTANRNPVKYYFPVRSGDMQTS